MRKLSILIFLLTSLSIHSQTTYYIATTGNDATGNGSISNPWKTLFKACNTVTSGNIIHINSGTYLENTRCVLAAGVTVEGEPDGTSIITNTSLTSRINYGPNGSNGDAILNLVSSSVINGNQEIRYLKFDGSNLTCSHALYIMNRHNVRIHHCTFINFNYCAVVWWASGTGDGIPPATRLSGSEFYNNTVTNSAGYNAPDGSYYGALYCGGHTGMLIHDNIMIENSHSVGHQGWPIKFWLWGGMMLGCKIYNNYLEKTDFSVWDFAIESTGEDGMEIYNNTIIGGIDLNKQNYSGVYAWSAYIHDNIIGPSSGVSALTVAGITLEHNNTNVLVERNTVQNCSPAILFTPRSQAQTNVIIRYNIFKNIRTSSYYDSGLTVNGTGGVIFSGFYIHNNIFHGYSPSNLAYGIRITHPGGGSYSGNNLQIINNIIMNFIGAGTSFSGPVYLTSAGSISNLYIQNNIFYNNGNSNEPLLAGTPNPYYYTTPIKLNPLFISSGTDFRLQTGSPAIDAGLDIGLTSDYLENVVPYGTSPDIGVYEYGSIGIPVYVRSVIENSTPSLLEMTYNKTLANVVSPSSAFTVKVNSEARIVNSVSISGTKVFLTLASPVLFGDIVTVAYTKPPTNPLQSTSGGQAASITDQVVTNNIAAIPVYVSSAIANATPDILEMTYNLTLVNIIPVASAFIVMVNSAARTVSSVSISGTKVLLTLSSPVVAGDVITVAYTKPTSNPLQTTFGGQAASMSAQPVTNNVAGVIPVYVSSAVTNPAPYVIGITYSQSLANIIPPASAFTVMVNSSARAVSSVSISGTMVFLTLVSPVVYGDVVTVAYTKPSVNPLQTPSGGQAASIAAQPVTNNVAAVVIPEYVSSVVENVAPTILEITYNLALANIIPSPSAFTVMVNSAARAVNSVSISGTKVLLTLASPVAYGDVITVAYTKPSANPLQTTSGGQAATISAQTVINNIADPDAPSIKIFPNPANEFINIRIIDPALVPDFIRIINLLGVEVLHDIVNPDVREFQIPVNLLHVGIYVVQIGTDNKTQFSQKLAVFR